MAVEAAAPVADGGAQIESTDAIVSELLNGSKNLAAESADPEPDDAPEPEPEANAEIEDALEADDPIEVDDGDELPSTVRAARKALEEGDIDKAFELAFGKKPEEIQPDNKMWTRWRAANDRELKKRSAKDLELTQREQNISAGHNQKVAQINQAIEQLRPYEKYFIAEQAFRRDGDPEQLVNIITGITGTDYDGAQKLILGKIKRSPEARVLQQRMQQLEQQLAEATKAKAENENKLSAEQVYANDIKYIETNVASVKGILQVPSYAKRIYKELIRTKGPLGLTLTPEQAALRVIGYERKRLANHPMLKGQRPANPVSQAASTLARARVGKGKPTGAPLRRDSQKTGAKDPAAVESTDDIVNDILKGKQRASA
jgi:hypothetical protein